MCIVFHVKRLFVFSFLLFVVYFVCHINAYKLAAFYLLYDWPNIHLKRLCNVSTLKHSPCPRLTVTPLNSDAFMLATSMRRIKGTRADKACVEQLAASLRLECVAYIPLPQFCGMVTSFLNHIAKVVRKVDTKKCF